MSDLIKTTYRKREYAKQDAWQEITKEDYENIVGIDEHADRLTTDMGLQMDSYFNERFGEQVIPQERLENKIDEAHKQSFKNRSVGSMEKGKRAKSASKKINLQRHMQKETTAYIEKRTEDRKNLMHYFDRSRVEDIEAVNDIYQTPAEKEALQEWLVGVDTQQDKNKINYNLLSTNEDVRVAEYKKILKSVAKMKVSSFAYSSDKEFVSQFGAKYNLLSKLASSSVFFYKLADYQKTHPDDSFQMRKIQAKLLIFQELKDHYEDKMALLSSPYYSLMSESDLKRYSGTSGERKLNAEVNSESFKAYVRSYRQVSESAVGKGKNLDTYLREREQILETNYQRTGEFEVYEPERISLIHNSVHEEENNDAGADAEGQVVEEEKQEEEKAPEQKEEEKVSEQKEEEKERENPFLNMDQEQQEYLDKYADDPFEVKGVDFFKEENKEEEKIPEQNKEEEKAPEQKEEKEAPKQKNIPVVHEEMYVNTPTGDEPGQEMDMDNPYLKEAQEKKVIEKEEKDNEAPEEEKAVMVDENMVINTPTGDEIPNPFGEESIENPFVEKNKENNDDDDDDFRLFKEEDFAYEIDDISLANLGKQYLDVSDSEIAALMKKEKEQEEAKKHWNGDESFLQENDEMGIAIADEDAKDLLDDELDASLEVEELKNDFLKDEDNADLDLDQVVIREKEEQERLEKERIEREEKEEEERQKQLEEERRREEEEEEEDRRDTAKTKMAMITNRINKKQPLRPDELNFLGNPANQAYMTEEFKEFIRNFLKGQMAARNANNAGEQERLEKERLEKERIEREKKEQEERERREQRKEESLDEEKQPEDDEDDAYMRDYAMGTMESILRKLKNDGRLLPDEEAFFNNGYEKYYTDEFREAADKYLAEKKAKAKAKKEKKEKERLEQERIEREKKEQEERERLEQERIEKEKKEAEEPKEDDEDDEFMRGYALGTMENIMRKLQNDVRLAPDEEAFFKNGYEKYYTDEFREVANKYLEEKEAEKKAKQAEKEKERQEQEAREKERVEKEKAEAEELEARVVEKFRNHEEMSPEENEYLNSHMKEVFNKALYKVDPLSGKVD